MIVTIDFGEKLDLLNKREFSDALAEDRALRGALTGVRSVDVFYNSGQTGGNSLTFTTPGQFGPSGGHVWAVMNAGLELALASAVRVYKGVPPAGGVIGGGRVAGVMASNLAPSAAFAKGQFMIRQGDQVTFVAATAGAFILSAFITAIECPAERIGELLL